MARKKSSYMVEGVSTSKFYELKQAILNVPIDLKKEIINQLGAIGEECVKYAREDHERNWGDVTGNLRSSIGYVVLWDGEPVIGGAPLPRSVAPGTREVTRHRKKKDGTVVEYIAHVKIGGDGKAGADRSKQLLEELRSKYPSGGTLILVAGMNYASFVESVHGKDVLTGASLIAEEKVERFIKMFSDYNSD